MDEKVKMFVITAAYGLLMMAFAFVFNQGLKNQDSIATLQLEVARNYATKPEIEDKLKNIENKIDDLFQALVSIESIDIMESRRVR